MDVAEGVNPKVLGGSAEGANLYYPDKGDHASHLIEDAFHSSRAAQAVIAHLSDFLL
ncbi:hypothetical protein [Rhizobium sp. GR12]|uniref:hypothetical protein n=1 Tax=Rhizobium sp. GR12 TaxID=3053925 RepID=UPI003FA745EA